MPALYYGKIFVKSFKQEFLDKNIKTFMQLYPSWHFGLNYIRTTSKFYSGPTLGQP